MIAKNERVKKLYRTLGLLAVIFVGAVAYVFHFSQPSSLTDEVSVTRVGDAHSHKQVEGNTPKTLQLAANTSPSASAEKTPRPSMPDIAIQGGVSGEEAIKALGGNIAAVAAFYRKTEKELVELLRHDSSLRVSSKGRLYYVDTAHKKVTSAQQSSPAPLKAEQVSSVSFTSIPLADTFVLHSKPGASKVIYLDFDGYDATASDWNDTEAPLIAKSYDNDGNTASFSDLEKREIQSIWSQVSDAFALFNIDVTTEDPGTEALTRTNGADTTFGVRVVVTTDSAISDRIGCFSSCTGVSYISAFDLVSTGDIYEPSWVFNNDPGYFSGQEQANFMANTVIHEVGHTLGLNHDGRTNPSEAYYEGHNGWVPIMGSNPGPDYLAQWSKGEYANANNAEDDLAIISANDGVDYVADDFGDTLESATLNASSLAPADGLTYSGVIEQAGESDFVSFNVDTTAPIRIKLWAGYGLHADFALFDASGSTLASGESKFSFSTGTIQQTLPQGLYKLRVRGIGLGNPLTTGYTNYGSVSAYTVQILDVSSLITPTPTPTNSPTATNTPTPIVDSDGDGIPNGTDTDDDNDKVLDVNDAFPLNSAESADSDNDAVGNNADTDDDNDGILDVDDAYPLSDALGGFKGKSISDNAGYSVAFVGDVNSDNYADYIVGAHLQNVGALTDAGAAYIVSGKTGQTLFTFNGDTAKDYFGFSVAGVGDVNDDDIPDVAVGAYLDDPIVSSVTVSDAGSVKVFSGADGSLIYQVTGTTSKEYFGYSVAGIYDVDGDNKTDIAVGAPLADVMNNTTLKLMKDAGKIQIFTNTTGTLYRTYYGNAASDNFGRAVAYAGDVNSDNFGDVIVGAPLGDVLNTLTLKLMKDAGYARVYSPNTDALLNPLSTLNGAVAGDNLGVSVSSAGDVNNDGTEDVIVGANKADVFNIKLMKDAGTATVYSGVDWNVINKFTGSTAADYFGTSVTGVSDINEDGFDDIAVGAYGFDAPIINSTKKLSSAGKVIVYSGQTYNELFGLSGTGATDYFGWSLSAGDINDDDKDELFVGAPKDDVSNNGVTIRDAGSVMVISGSYIAP